MMWSRVDEARQGRSTCLLGWRQWQVCVRADVLYRVRQNGTEGNGLQRPPPGQL